MRPKVATFDCYGTLVDWEGGLGAFLYTLMLREGVDDPPPGRELRERWEQIQFDVIQGEYKPYKEVLGESVLAWCREFGVPDRDVYAEALVDSMRAWQPFPDTRPALTQVREAGVRLVILSNTDRDIIEPHAQADRRAVRRRGHRRGRRRLQARAHGLRATCSTGSARTRATSLHVAFGFKYDIGPAKQLGMRIGVGEPPPGAAAGPGHRPRPRMEGPMGSRRAVLILIVLGAARRLRRR